MPRKPSAKTLRNRCDKLFSKIIRAVGECEICGSKNNLQCAHIISRKFSWTRCDERNAISTCARCHFRLDHEFRADWYLVLENLGKLEDYEDLKEILAQKKGHSVDWGKKYAELQRRYNQILKGRG